MDAAAGMDEIVADCDPPSVYGSCLPDATICPSFPTAPNTQLNHSIVTLVKVIEDVGVPAEADLEASEFHSDLHPSNLPGAFLAPSAVPSKLSPATSNGVKKPAASDKSPRTWKEARL